jgi:hypothetical protein
MTVDPHDRSGTRSREPASNQVWTTNEMHHGWLYGTARRVKGRTGARFKKAMSQADEAQILRDWRIE